MIALLAFATLYGTPNGLIVYPAPLIATPAFAVSTILPSSLTLCTIPTVVPEALPIQ